MNFTELTQQGFLRTWFYRVPPEDIQWIRCMFCCKKMAIHRSEFGRAVNEKFTKTKPPITGEWICSSPDDNQRKDIKATCSWIEYNENKCKPEIPRL